MYYIKSFTKSLKDNTFE